MHLPDLNRCMIEFMLPKVQKGVAWLDETQPGWYNRIALDELRLESSRHCICGQLFGDYMSRPLEVGESPEDYGFTVELEDSIWSSDILSTCDCEDCVNRREQGEDLLFEVPPFYGELAWKTLDLLWSEEVDWRTSGV